MKGLLALLIFSVLVSGCISKSQKELEARTHDVKILRASSVSEQDIEEYERSKFAKNRDMRGFLMSKKAQKARASDEQRAKFDQDSPLLLKHTKACVMRNDFLSEKELQITAKQCFPSNFNNGLTPPAWSNEVIDKAVADLSPHFVQVRAQMKAEARQRAAEDRQQAAQDKRDREVEAQRAYDNSLKSLIE